LVAKNVAHQNKTNQQVLTRGSQYRVEAVMQRILKARNFVAISPTKNQVGWLARPADFARARAYAPSTTHRFNSSHT
jgi:hypothetical protein